MSKLNRLLLLIPALLLTSCNFKYEYIIDGIEMEEEDMGGDDGIDDSGTYNVKIWVDTKIVSLTQAQITDFNASNSKIKFNADVQPVSEGSATSNMLLDVKNGADLFVFAQDQLARLKVGGALSKITGSFEDRIVADNSAESVAAAMMGNSIYAYPMTSDNGYFLMYDKSVFTNEADVANMSTLLSKMGSKRLYFKAQSDGFYAASYWLAKEKDKPESDTLCSCTWDLDEDTGTFYDFHDTFHDDNGLIAAKGLKEIADKSLVTSDNSVSKFGSTAAAVVTGIWDYEAAYNRLGENLGCAEMPCFTVDGKTYHLGSYDGYKLLGVKPQRDAKRASACRKLAQFLAGEACQTERFQKVSWGPTNINSSKEPEVLAHPGLAALAKQHKYATQQAQCPGEWFLSLKTAASGVTPTSSDAQLRTILDNYYAGLPVLLSDE